MACCVALEYKDGSKYCGESEKGILHGCGVFVESSNRGVYEGLWVNGGQHRGVFSWPNGKHYSGDWKGPVRIGLGVEKRPDGTKYSGEFSQNVMGPLGVLSLPTHGLYMGMWDSSGLQEGRGVEAYADGGFYRGQYKKGQRGGYGTRSSAGYEKIKDSTDLGRVKKPSVTSLMERNFMQPLSSSTLQRVRGDSSRSSQGNVFTDMGSVGDMQSNWKQIYEGQWVNDKRCGYGVLKVSDCFTYYGQWDKNTRTGYGVLIREGEVNAKKREEIREEGRWDNGKLVERVKQKKVIKSDTKLRVEEAHQEAIKAAISARDMARLAESKANAAAAKSKVAEVIAREGRQHAATAVARMERTAKISQQAVEDACKIKGSVRITLNGDLYGNNLDLSKTYPGTSLSRSASYSYLQLAAESVGSASTSGSRGIPMVSSWHNIHERSKGSANYSSYADSDGD